MEENLTTDDDFDFCENTNEIQFRYTNGFHIVVLWFCFAIIGSLFFVLLGYTNFDTLFINTFNLAGLIIYMLLAIILFVGLFCGSYFFAIKLTDRNGLAVFYDDYVEINMGQKYERINYLEILQMKYIEYSTFKVIQNHYRFKIKCKDVKMNIRSSSKELFELKLKDKKLFSRKQYRLSLANVYDKIYFNIFSKNEPK